MRNHNPRTERGVRQSLTLRGATCDTQSPAYPQQMTGDIHGVPFAINWEERGGYSVWSLENNYRTCADWAAVLRFLGLLPRVIP